jgi:lysophospholipase L1-like esterase
MAERSSSLLKAGHSCAGKLVLLTFGFSLPLLAAELVLRVLDRNPAGGKEQRERNRYTGHDPELGWRKTPGARVAYTRPDYRSEFVINAQGLRGPLRPYAKPPGTLRVLALGDSFTEAFMLNDEETMTSQLERQLRSRVSCMVEVINGGTVGYSTDQEYLFYRSEGRRYAPDVTLLLTYHNDIPYLVRDRYYDIPKPRLSFDETPPRVVNHPVPAYQPSDATTPAAPSFEGSHLLEFIKNRVERTSALTYNRIAGLGFWEPLRTLPRNEELDLFHVPAYGHLIAAWSAYTWTVESLNRLVEADRSRLLVAYVPSRMEISEAEYEITQARYGITSSAFDRSAVRDRLRSVSRKLRIPFLDFTPALTAGATYFRPVYFPSDSHWNARGQAIAAEATAAFLLDQNLLKCPS